MTVTVEDGTGRQTADLQWLDGPVVTVQARDLVSTARRIVRAVTRLE